MTTWARLIELEPRLEDLRREAAAFGRRNTARFCANDAWYGMSPERRGLKARMERLVGAMARPDAPDELVTSQAYETAYQTIYNALPHCRGCACWDGGKAA